MLVYGVEQRSLKNPETAMRNVARLKRVIGIPARFIRRARIAISRGRLEARSQQFRQLFPDRSRIRRVATGFRFTEGPVWIRGENSLLFSDIPADIIYRLDEQCKVSRYRHPSRHSNGLTLDRHGRLIVCEHGGRRVSRIEQDGSVTVMAKEFQGRRLNSPNDVVVKSDGAIYFTDPPYGIRSAEQEQPWQGVYRISPDGNSISLVADDFDRPNGLAFSPDETRLYVADSSSRRHIRVFDMLEDGALSDGRIFCDMNTRASGVPDGMKVDPEGHIFCAGPGGVWVVDKAGNHLGTIVLPEQPSNCCWGGEDARSLYVTARTSIYEVRVQTPCLVPYAPGRNENVGEVSR
jgi:gluconolactonase